MAPANQQINAAAAAAGGDNEEQQDPAPMNFMSIMNWILFFWIFQNLSGMIASKFVPPPPNAANMMPAAATGVEGNDVAVPQMKPLGANPMDKKSTAHDAKKVNRMMKPACLWQQGTMMDLDLIISDSPEVPAGWPSLTIKSDNDKEQVTKGTILASWTQQDLILGGRPHDPYAKAS